MFNLGHLKLAKCTVARTGPDSDIGDGDALMMINQNHITQSQILLLSPL